MINVLISGWENMNTVIMQDTCQHNKLFLILKEILNQSTITIIQHVHILHLILPPLVLAME